MRSLLTKHPVSFIAFVLYTLFLFSFELREDLSDPNYLFTILLAAWTVLPLFIYENVYRSSHGDFSSKEVKISNAAAFVSLPLATIILFTFTIYDVFFSTTESSSTASIGLIFISFWPLVFGAIPVMANHYFVDKAKKSASTTT
jgi:hypothetical protein